MKIDLTTAIGSIVAGGEVGAPVSSTTVNGQIIDCRHMNNVSVTAAWTGTPTGTLNLQASNDQINWYNISGATLSLSGAAGSGRLTLTDFPDQYLMPVYVPASGSGTLFVQVNTKGI